MKAICGSNRRQHTSALALATLVLTCLLSHGAPSANPASAAVFQSDWGEVVDGLRCRVKHLVFTNFTNEPEKVFLHVTLELTNVGSKERRVLIEWRRGSTGPFLRDFLLVSLIPKGGEPADSLSNQSGIDLDDPVFTTKPDTKEVKDMFLSLHPQESKLFRVTLGIDRVGFARHAENAPTQVCLYHIIPASQQKFRGEMPARRMFWEGPMKTGAMILTRPR